MLDLADFIARHAIAILLLFGCVLLIATALFWHLLHTHGGRLFEHAARLWNTVRNNSHLRRLKRAPVVGPFFSRTLSAVRYLGLYAVFGFTIAIASVFAFFALADEIGFDEDLARFDAALAAALDRHLSYETLRAFSLITHLGDRDVLIVLAGAVTIALLIAKRWVLAGAWVVATAGGGFMNMLLKELFERPRPVHDHGLVNETSWSFPSGHASGSMLIYSLLGYLIVRHAPRAWHIPVAVITVAFIVFVGSSRVMLQVHYFSDVLAGYASAGAWSAMCIAGLETVRWREGNSIGRKKTQKKQK